MKRLGILCAILALAGCSTVKVVDQSSETPPKIVMSPAPPPPAPVVVAASPPVAYHDYQPKSKFSYAMAEMEGPMPKSFDRSAPADPEPPKTVKKKAVAIVKKVVESVISTANAATKSETTTLVYDKVGEVQTKTVVESHDSLVGILTKIIGLLTGTLGLYVGWKKWREPAKVA
jgi:hypothetical protein